MNREIRSIVLLLFILVFTDSLFAQTGTLKGILKDETGEPAFDVTVVIPNLKLGTITGFEGEYEIRNIPPGIYKIYFKGVGFKTDSLTGVEIKANEVTTIDRTLQGEGGVTQVDIVERKNEESQVTAIENVKKNETQIVQASGEQIRQSSDRNAADAIRRLPGVSLIDNRFIMVRGLSERYNSVWLNDAGAPSAEPDRKAFSFDIIQSQLIEKIQVFKTPAPDLPGDFAGGMAKIYTRASATKRDFQMALQGSYRPGSTFNTFNYTDKSSWDFLGFGAKSRALPSGLPDYINKADPDYATVSRAFKNNWGINNKTAIPDIRFSTLYANRIKIGKKLDLGSTSALNYSNLNTIFRINRYDWVGIDQSLGVLDKQYTNLVNLGLAQNFSLIINANNSLQYRNLFNQTGRTQTTLRNSELETAPNAKSYALGYQSRQVYTSQLSGQHGDSITEYRWTAGYAYSNRVDPDLRRIKYVKQRAADDSMYQAQVPSGAVDPVNGGGKFYSNLYERTYSYNHNFKQRIKIKDYKFDLNVGNYFEYKERSFNARLLGYVLMQKNATTFPYLFQPIGQIFDPSHVGTSNGFRIDEGTSPSDSYKAQNKLIASYASFTLPIGHRFKLLTGARYEHNIQSLESYVSTQKVTPKVTTDFVLPSANLTYKISEKSQLRAAVGKTLNRPEFREWSPFGFYDFDFSAFTYGSLFPALTDSSVGSPLKVAKIWNADLRYELYPSPLEMFHVGLFYKHFQDPIQQVILSSGGDSRTFTYTNAISAKSAGVEIDIRKNLAFADNYFNTKFLKNISFVANASYIVGTVQNSEIVNQQKKNRLPGQSPYLINTGIYYQAGSDSTALQFSLLYNVFGSRIFLVGVKDYPNIGEMPRNTVDLTINKAFSKSFAVVGAIQDIFNQPILLVQDTNRNGKFERHGDDKKIMSFRRGTYFTVGVRIKL